MLKRSLILCGLILLVLTGCAPTTREAIEKPMELKIKMTMLEPGVVSISAGMYNSGKFEYPGDDDFKGVFTILDEGGNLINESKVNEFSALAAGEKFFPFTYEMTLEPGTYRVQFSALEKPAIEIEFEIVEKEGVLNLIAPQENIDPFTMYTNAS